MEERKKIEGEGYLLAARNEGDSSIVVRPGCGRECKC